MESDEGEDETLQVLDQIVEDGESFRVLAVLHVEEGADLTGGEGDVGVGMPDLEFLPTDLVRDRPVLVVLPRLINTRYFMMSLSWMMRITSSTTMLFRKTSLRMSTSDL